MWVVSTSLPWLLVVQCLAGMAWAAYELATFLLLFETIPEEERTSVLTLFNASHALATVTGAACGGWLLHTLGTDHNAYLAIFGISGCVRLLTIALLARAARVLPAKDVPQPMPIPTRVVAVQPNLGSIERPILPAFSRQASHVEAATERAALHATLATAGSTG
jgi:MFS family permease